MASLYRKLRKLTRDPIAYCLDSRHGLLRASGARMFAKQTLNYETLGAANAHRKITVVMTAYNTGHLVEAAIASVLAQSHQNFELMVIDDASTDDTLDILKAMAARDGRVKVYHSPQNHGTYWSKNWCLSQATGEFVAFHDSDDRSAPMRLQMQLGAMLAGRGVDAVTCRWRRVDDEDNVLVIDGLPSRMAAISLMIRRDKILGGTGYFDSVRISADTEFIGRIGRVFGKKNLRHMRQILYTGLLRDGSLTTSENSGFSWKADGRSFERELSGDRADYHDAFSVWHNENMNQLEQLTIAFPPTDRKFPAPEQICGGCDDNNITAVLLVAGEHTLAPGASVEMPSNHSADQRPADVLASQAEAS